MFAIIITAITSNLSTSKSILFIQDIDGVLPIVADQDITGATEISMDLTPLDNREAP